MAALLHDDVFDNGLNAIKNNTENLYILKGAQPTSFAEATGANKVGTKASPAFTGPADDTSGRKLTVNAITDGSVSADGTAGWWALCDDSASKMLASGELNATQVVTNGNTFTLTAFKINIPDPV